MSTRTSDMVGSVLPAQGFDAGDLFRYAQSHVDGFPSSPTSFKVSQFGHGQSNPTFLVEVSSGASTKRYVLRKKPSGTLLESAHAVEREFFVLNALYKYTSVPVPKVFCLCTDVSVIGTAFYIMEFLDGRIFVDSKLPGLSARQRKSIYSATAKTLASLHSVDPEALGLNKYGRRDNYCKRQVERWARQYLASTGEGKPERNPKMLDLIGWLKQSVPLEDSSTSATGLVHGDFRIDNLVFHPLEDQVIGILDWELSTLGNQMSDVAYSCMPYIMEVKYGHDVSYEGFESIGIPDGIPSLAGYLAEYCFASKKPWPVAEWKFYIAFSLFRGAAIMAGVYHRWTMGNASGGQRAQYGQKICNAMIDVASAFIKRSTVLPEEPPRFQPNLEFYPRSNESNHPNHDLNLEGGKFVPSQQVLQLKSKLQKFMDDHVYPMENEFNKRAFSELRWTVHPEEENLKELAKMEGLWNLWLPLDSSARTRELLLDASHFAVQGEGNSQLLGAGLSTLEYGHLCEIMGRSVWAPQVFNCGAPDMGNMEVLLRCGTKEQQRKWLIPLPEGKIRSGFAMTEPKVASSDATNIECSITREGDSYVINGIKWWTSGAMDPDVNF